MQTQRKTHQIMESKITFDSDSNGLGTVTFKVMHQHDEYVQAQE